mgnify:CR=1 FL=1
MALTPLHTATVHTESYGVTPLGRRMLLVNAVVAWGGVLLTVALSAAGAYREQEPEPGVYGDNGDGLMGAVSRVTDTLSYFTIWSNIAVAVSLTLLVSARLGAAVGPRWLRVLRLDGLLMIVVTAIVYQVLLAPTTEVAGWSVLTDPWLHVVTPVLTVVVWGVWGPRGWVTGRLVPAALVIPLAWIAWMLARGAVLGVYPYGFVAVGERGLGPVLVTLVMILAFGLVVALVLWGVDVLLGRRSTDAHAPVERAG